MSVVFNRCRTCCSRFLTMFWLAQATLFYKNLQLLQQNDVIHKTSKKRGIQVFVNRYTSCRHRYILAMFVRLINTTSKSLYVLFRRRKISLYFYIKNILIVLIATKVFVSLICYWINIVFRLKENLLNIRNGWKYFCFLQTGRKKCAVNNTFVVVIE